MTYFSPSVWWLLLALLICQELGAQIIIPLVGSEGEQFQVNDVVEDSFGRLWLATEAGLYSCSDGHHLVPAGTDRQRLTSVEWTGKRLIAAGPQELFVVEIAEKVELRQKATARATRLFSMLVSDSSGGVLAVEDGGQIRYYRDDQSASSFASQPPFNFQKEIEGSYRVLGADEKGRVWASDARALLLFDPDRVVFDPVGSVQGGLAAILVSEDVSGRVYFISEDHEERRASLYQWTDGGGLEKLSQSIPMGANGRGVDGAGFVDGMLWVSILGQPNELRRPQPIAPPSVYERRPIDLGLFEGHSVKLIEQVGESVLLIGETGVLRRRAGETDFSLVTHEGSFEHVLHTRDSLVLWGREGAFSFFENVTIHVEYNESFDLLRRGWVFDSAIRVDSVSYRDEDGRNPFRKSVQRNFEIAIASTKEGLEKRKQLDDYRPLNEGYTPDQGKGSFKVHASVLDAYRNVVDPEPQPVLMVADFSFLLVSTALSVIAVLSFFSWLPLWVLRRIRSAVPLLVLRRIHPAVLYMQYASYSVLFVLLAFVPRILQKFYLLTFLPMGYVMRRLYIDLWLERRGSDATGAIDDGLPQLEEQNRSVVLSRWDCPGSSLEEIACEAVREGIGGAGERIPVVCHLEDLPNSDDPDLVKVVEKSVLGALETEMWFLDSRFCQDLLLRSQFLFVFEVDIWNDAAFRAIRLFFENSGAANRMILKTSE